MRELSYSRRAQSATFLIVSCLPFLIIRARSNACRPVCAAQPRATFATAKGQKPDDDRVCVELCDADGNCLIHEIGKRNVGARRRRPPTPARRSICGLPNCAPSVGLLARFHRALLCSAATSSPCVRPANTFASSPHPHKTGRPKKPSCSFTYHAR